MVLSLLKLTQSHSRRWIVVEHQPNDLEQLQMLGSLRQHVTVQWLRVITNVPPRRRLLIPI